MVVIGNCHLAMPATTKVALGGSWLRIWIKFSGVAGMPPSTPITNWKCAGSLINPFSMSLMPWLTKPTSKTSISGLMFASSIFLARNVIVFHVLT